MSSLTTIIATARPPFLVLTPLCVLLGYAAVVTDGHAVAMAHAVLVLLGAIAAHIGVNMLNEYEDFRSGLDFKTEKTPFSGGSGALPADPRAAPLVLSVAVSSLVATFLVGIYFVYLRGAVLLALGLVGLLVILTYTRWLNRYAWPCLVAPGLGFGPLMVWGTSIALTGEITPAALWLSLPPFFLVNNLLLLNQYPDVEADRSVGRDHFVVRYGAPASTAVYGVFLLSAYMAVAVSVARGALPPAGLIALASAPLAVSILLKLVRRAGDRRQLVAQLGLNVAVVLSTVLLLSVGVLMGGGESA